MNGAVFMGIWVFTLAACLLTGAGVGPFMLGLGLLSLAYIFIRWAGWILVSELCARRSRASRPRRGDAHAPAHAPRTCLPKIVAASTTSAPPLTESTASPHIGPLVRNRTGAAAKHRP